MATSASSAASTAPTTKPSATAPPSFVVNGWHPSPRSLWFRGETPRRRRATGVTRRIRLVDKERIIGSRLDQQVLEILLAEQFGDRDRALDGVPGRMAIRIAVAFLEVFQLR